ncbi:S-layer homology domain-containing protein [Paenibacillus sp. CGMCC 1.16610]|uniref:SLH domain-containing protein n=1 Tax=Paenibacillus anseongense TaxID=2682845 RepID=A0ABW9U9G8_9BACL|nr:MULTISPECIES: S-layer homology domain-containing protein [Paenibacillus]MBA2942052.1 S-layer homology domain-containing protein [Paenibacillus sp. CGMCC 1.16610]MVQ35885.1 hypothetical protein [Paenibacillus anseongense]
MKKKGLLFALCLFLCISFSSAQAMAAESPSYSLSLTSNQTQVGSQVRVVVKGTHVTDLFGYEIRLSYDTTHLRFIKGTSPMNGFSVPAIVKEGQVVFAHTKVGKLPGDSGDVELASFTFENLLEGPAEIKLVQVKEVTSAMQAATVTSDSKLAMDITPKLGMVITFSDMANHWAQKAVERAASLGIVNGYDDGTFQPDGKVTRAEFTAMLVRAISLTSKDAQNMQFSDIDDIPQWAKAYIFEAASAGVVTGYEDHSFGADRLISRAEMAVMVARAIGLEINSDEAVSFADEDQIPAWALQEIKASRKAGLIQGRDNNFFVPDDQATRAEAAVLILAAYDNFQSANER